MMLMLVVLMLMHVVFGCHALALLALPAWRLALRGCFGNVRARRCVRKAPLFLFALVLTASP